MRLHLQKAQTKTVLDSFIVNLGTCMIQHDESSCIGAVFKICDRFSMKPCFVNRTLKMAPIPAITTGGAKQPTWCMLIEKRPKVWNSEILAWLHRPYYLSEQHHWCFRHHHPPVSEWIARRCKACIIEGIRIYHMNRYVRLYAEWWHSGIVHCMLYECYLYYVCHLHDWLWYI